ncbi:hypothetical protein AHF37_12406 [Paragonimus kellicotti]|nr:hypothetical protein AHF37_12406 [Paragonimus kellicotti]
MRPLLSFLTYVVNRWCLLLQTRNAHLDVLGPTVAYMDWSRRVVDMNKTLRELCRPGCLLTESCTGSNGQFVSTFTVLYEVVKRLQ